MMAALFVAILAAVFLTSEASAQSAYSYTVHGSVVFARAGERTPMVGSDQVKLTSVGAQAMYSVGEFFRQRYIEITDSQNPADAPIYGLSNLMDYNQVYALSPDDQYAQASALAFMQAMYPPFDLDNSTSLSIDSTSITSDNHYIQYPLGGYQYPSIASITPSDPMAIFIAGDNNCVNYVLSGTQYWNSQDAMVTTADTTELYTNIGEMMLEGIFPRSSWTYRQAYSIWEYVSYQYAHNRTAYDLLTSGGSPSGALSQLRWLADQAQWAQNGDLTATYRSSGPAIRAIAGRTFASQVLRNLYVNIATKGAFNKFSLFVGDYQPLVSLFSLLNLGDLNENFYGMPEPGSVAVFELFSYDVNGSNPEYPNIEDLQIQFFFRNGTDGSADNGDYTSHPMFGRGPSQTVMYWTDFLAEMGQIELGNTQEWCDVCGASAVFCAFFNEAIDGSPYGGSSSPDSSGSGSGGHGGVSPAVGGVIGAVVTLAVAGLLFAIAVLFGGMRVHRVRKGSKSDLAGGGFKGSDKLASDADLSIKKNAAPVAGATVEHEAQKGHERVGSWELKEAGAQREGERHLGAPPAAAATRPSFEDDHDHDDGVNPFGEAVKADERV
ncbi:phosphoglycerate mutase-like protein [Aulographum hederae CBS 113979]|uniref:Phosphoglycerate mutase-like protein n=1 Tax=Aulographum hederae CBS 113979 TaxID=1176131 RepID=A0A6G1H8C4_9PEZI|nr:phosphoglycerate mutase-like protein [Aulographum hederae CBS 113979]